VDERIDGLGYGQLDQIDQDLVFGGVGRAGKGFRTKVEAVEDYLDIAPKVSGHYEAPVFAISLAR